MLLVDLRRLQREGRLHVEQRVEPDDPLWSDVTPPVEAVDVDLEVQKVGGDILARGVLRGAVELPCRRCLEPVRERVEEELTLLFRPESDLESAADDGDVYAIPARTQDLDLAPAVREQWLLSAPAFLLCREECRGLCPHCGIDRNQATCDCSVEETDERWGPLLRLERE